MKIELHEHTAIPVITEYDVKRRLLRKCTLANGYGMYYDLFYNKYFVHPDAEKVSREDWKGFIVGNDYYIYVDEDGE